MAATRKPTARFIARPCTTSSNSSIPLLLFSPAAPRSIRKTTPPKSMNHPRPAAHRPATSCSRPSNWPCRQVALPSVSAASTARAGPASSRPLSPANPFLSVLLHVASLRQPGIFNAVDDHPSRRDDLAESIRTGAPTPANEHKMSSGKRVRNTKLRRTGWSPRYPSILNAVEARSF